MTRDWCGAVINRMESRLGDPFIYDMASAFAQADVVVARAGAMTVSEIALAGRPAIFVPYPFHRDRQQEYNARTPGAPGWRTDRSGRRSPG